MLPQRWRLPLRKERFFFAKARQHHYEGITVFYVENSQELKFGIILPKHQFPLSTTRHKISRRLHQILIEIITKSPPHHGHYAFVLSRSTLHKKIPEIKQIILHHLDYFQEPT